jgi:hypothetical protein
MISPATDPDRTIVMSASLPVVRCFATRTPQKERFETAGVTHRFRVSSSFAAPEPWHAMNAGDSTLRSRTEAHRTGEPTPAEIEARVRWARRQGYVAWFWPDVPIAGWRAGLLEIERVAGLLIGRTMPGTRAHNTRLCFDLPDHADARALGIAAFTSGMGPLLGYWIECGLLNGQPDVDAVLRVQLQHSRRRAERMQLATMTALDLLGEAGCEPILVKSAHTSLALFEEPGLRPAADIDLVVESTRYAQAEEALAHAGYRLVKRRRNPRKSDWAPPGAPSSLRSLDFTHEANPFTLELHGSLDREFYGVRTLRFGFIAHLGVVPAPDIHPRARVLAQPLLATYLAAHASEELHQLQLIRLVELALLIRRDVAAGVLDWRELDSLLANRAAHRFTFPAVALVERLAPGTIDPWFLARISSSASERMKGVLGRMTPATAQRLDELSLDERFLWTEGSVEIVRRLLHLFRPPHDGRSLLRYWADRLTRLVRGRVSLRRGGDVRGTED